MQITIIINQILILAILAGIGAVATKFRIITESVKEGITKLVFNITLPALIFTSVLKVEFTKELFANAITVFLLSLVAIGGSLFLGKLSGKLQRLDQKKAAVHMLHTGFGNVAFLGYPLFTALFPEEGLFYAIIYHLSQDIFIWTVGVIAFNKHKSVSFKQNVSHLINPNTVTFFISLILLAFGYKLPEIFNNSLSGLGKTTIYLAMLFIGAVLVQNPMISAFRKKEIYILIFNKMLLIPVFLGALVLIIERILNFEYSNVAITVLIMQAAMPCMAMVVVLAKKFQSDDIHAAENLFLTTIFSLISLPFIYYLIQIYL